MPDVLKVYNLFALPYKGKKKLFLPLSGIHALKK
jgi:hypothetical protein